MRPRMRQKMQQVQSRRTNHLSPLHAGISACIKKPAPHSWGAGSIAVRNLYFVYFGRFT